MIAFLSAPRAGGLGPRGAAMVMQMAQPQPVTDVVMRVVVGEAGLADRGAKKDGC